MRAVPVVLFCLWLAMTVVAQSPVPSGGIYVTDSGNGRVVRVNDMTGAGWVSFGTEGTGTNQFSGPAWLAFDKLGRLYISDGLNHRIVSHHRSGCPASQVSDRG